MKGQSTAHEYDARGQCLHCGMYRVNVERLSHACKPWREALVEPKTPETGDAA